MPHTKPNVVTYIKPTIVNSSEELDKAVSDCRTAIVVLNSDIIPAIKKEIKREDILAKAKKISGGAVIGGLAAFVAADVAGVLAVAFAPALVAPAATVMLVGACTTLGASAVSLSNVLRKMKHYAWVDTEDSDKKLLVIKVSGRNKFNPKEDKISSY